MLKYRFWQIRCYEQTRLFSQIKVQIRNAFNKLSAHGEPSGDNLIDKRYMAFIYALSNEISEESQIITLQDFEINGLIGPEEYAVNENNLFEADDNMASFKLRLAFKVLKQYVIEGKYEKIFVILFSLLIINWSQCFSPLKIYCKFR